MTGFAASVLLSAAPAHAIDFYFQFQDTSGTNGLITGTLTGLVEGQNFPGTGITATITSTPNNDLLGTYTLNGYAGSQAFVVTNGVITSANAQLNNANFDVLQLSFGPGSGGTFILPGLSSNLYADFGSTTTQFTSATPVPFESSPIAIPASLAVCFGVAKLRKKHLDKKQKVSVDA